MTEPIVAVLLVVGAAFAMTAGVGLVRLPDVIIRMHASTKAGTLGAGLVLAAVAVHYGDPAVVLRAAATIAFLLITAPVSAHVIGRAAYRAGVPLSEHTGIDELREASRPARRAAAPGAPEAAGDAHPGADDRTHAGGEL